jgi:hypothetical protein
VTVRVRVELGTRGAKWEYAYDNSYALLFAYRVAARIPFRTLLGAFDLVVDRDWQNTLVSIESLRSPSRWRVVADLQVPPAASGQVYVSEDISGRQDQGYFTDPQYSILCVQLLEERPQQAVLQHVAIAEQVVVGVEADCTLASIWLLGLPPEIAARPLTILKAVLDEERVR